MQTAGCQMQQPASAQLPDATTLAAAAPPQVPKPAVRPSDQVQTSRFCSPDALPGCTASSTAEVLLESTSSAACGKQVPLAEALMQKMQALRFCTSSACALLVLWQGFANPY